MSKTIHHTPSVESLKLAVEFCNASPVHTTAEDALRTAALFEGYLLGGFVPDVTAHNLDGMSVALSDIIRSFPDPNILDVSDVARGGFPGGNRTHNIPDESVSAPAIDVVSTHSSSPSEVSKNPAPDSHSEAGTGTVAKIDLSKETLPTLYFMAEHARNTDLLRAASLELNARRGAV